METIEQNEKYITVRFNEGQMLTYEQICWLLQLCVNKESRTWDLFHALLHHCGTTMSVTLSAIDEGRRSDISPEQRQYWENWQQVLMGMLSAARTAGFPF
ncbi:MAG TPA: hypothetical protein V6C65_04085 [Allocoleopsis sp.]